MRPRKYDQDAHNYRICPHCRGAYSHAYISKHVRRCVGDPVPSSQSSGGAILRRKAARELAALLAEARKLRSTTP